MSSKVKIAIEFGVPEHGWLPITLDFGEYHLELDVSDVPVNSMVQLCDASIQICKGIKEPSRVMWHLEPYCYYLQLKIIDGGYKAILLESEALNSPAKKTKEISGSFDAIVLPFYEGLKRFWSQSYKEPHWEELDGKRIETLDRLMKERIG